MTLLEIAAKIEKVCARGGAVQVQPYDALNPGFGYQASVTMATPWQNGPEQYRGESDVGAMDALSKALEQVPG